MFIVIKSEHYDCTNLICKKDTLEEAVAAVKDSMAQRINKNYHAGLTGTDITHENEDHYGFSFTFDENRNADSIEPLPMSRIRPLISRSWIEKRIRYIAASMFSVQAKKRSASTAILI